MRLQKVVGVVVLALALAGLAERGYSQLTSNLTYTVIDLGSLRADGAGTSDAHAIDSQGDVVGVADDDNGFQQAFLWQAATGIKNLKLSGNGNFNIGGDNSAAFGISYTSGAGNSEPVRFIVGEANPPALSAGSEHALFLGPSGLVDLNGQQAFSGGPNSAASAVNTNGVTVGWAVLAGNFSYHAFRYSAPTLVDLGTLPGGSLSVGVALNNLGDVVGSSSDSNGIGSAVVWSHSGSGATKISGMTVATGINDQGLVVGKLLANVGDGVQAVTYRLGASQSVSLATISNQSSVAWGVNNHGQIVGASGNGTVIRSPGITTGVSATLWNGSNSVVDLNTRISAAGWHLSTAEAINDAGQIVGSGFHNGIKRAFLLVLPPAISSPTVAPRELLPAGGTVTISAVVSNNVAADSVSASISGTVTSAVQLAAQPDNFYTGTFNVPANSTTNSRIYAISIQAGSGLVTSAGTITVAGVSGGMLKVSSTNLVFKTTKVKSKATLTVKLQNTGSGPLRIKVNGPYASFGMLAFKVLLPGSSRSTLAADGSVWLSLAPKKTVVATVTFQPFATLAVSDQISISSNATGQPPFVVKFSGTGK